MPGINQPIFWLYGMSGAGKTTLAYRLHEQLRALGQQAAVLDADRCRKAFWPELGLSLTDRQLNVERLARLAALCAEMGPVIVAAMTPTRKMQQAVKTALPTVRMAYISCPLDVLRERDPKGLYASQSSASMWGVCSPFEYDPQDVCVDTGAVGVAASFAVLWGKLFAPEHNI